MNIVFNYKTKRIINLSALNFSKLKNEKLYFSGSFAYKKKINDRYYTIRDSVGSKKLFYGTNNKKIIFSNSYVKLLKKCNKKTIFSVPKGCLMEMDLHGKVLSKNFYQSEEINLNNFKKVFLSKLSFFLKIIKKRYGNSCYVCLSGGLDSTIILYLAKKIFKNPIAVSATFEEKGKNFFFSSDMVTANKICKKLKIKIINFKFNYKDIQRSLNRIILSSQDWRDYNVHCATLNYFIAKNLKKLNKNFPILTGDMMNEYCSDYKTEVYKKKKFYQIPKINKKVLQRYLISGLDSSNREIGVFSHFNLTLFQPYCVLSELYKCLPDALFNKNFKYKLNGVFVSKSLINIVSKKKNRAQINDNNGGILGYFIDNNITQHKLLNIFLNKLSVSKKWLRSFIVAGQFRTKS